MKKQIVSKLVSLLTLTFSATLLISFVGFIVGCSAATSTTPTTPTSDASDKNQMTPSTTPPPSISIVSFSTNNVTIYASNFIITANAPDELVVSGTCEPSEDGHTVEVLDQAISTNNIVATNLTKTTTCTEAGTGSSATWTTTLTRDDLNILRTNNMRASFQASIINDAGLTGETSTQNLFVVPDIEPFRDNNNRGKPNIVFEDIAQIESTCRIVIAFNVDSSTSPGAGYSIVANPGNSFVSLNTLLQTTGEIRIRPNRAVDAADLSALGISTYRVETRTLSSNQSVFLALFSVDTISNSNNTYRFRMEVGGVQNSKTYHDCGMGPVPSN